MTQNDTIDPFEDSFNENNENYDQLFTELFSESVENESTLFLLLTREELPNIILNYNNYCHNQSNQYYQYIIGLINLMQKLAQIHDDMIDLWIKSLKQTENCILSTIFKSLPNCYSDLCLPKIVDFMSNSDFQMSFYEYVCFNICGFVLTLNEYQINFVEELLFESLLSNECVSNLLASDVLCFIARQSKSPLCYHYSCLLFNMSLHIDDYCFANFVSVLNRILPFLQELEVEYLIKDYDIITYSKVWQNLNLSLILSSQQINDIFFTISSMIENEKIITNEKIHILMSLLLSDEISDKNRENLSQSFAEKFLTSDEVHFYCDFIDLLIVLIPNTTKEMLLKLMTKLRNVLIKAKPNLDLISVVSKFLCHVSIVEMPVSLENQFIKIFVLILQQLFDYATNFYAKYSVLTAMTNISLKSKFKSIITECCKNQNIKKALKQHLIKFKVNCGMDENEKIEYLQNTIECGLKRRQLENNSQTVIEKSQTFCLGENSQNRKRKMSEESECGFPTIIDVNNYNLNEKIDFMEKCIDSLKQNRALINAHKDKQRLVTVFYELNDVIDRLKQ